MRALLATRDLVDNAFEQAAEDGRRDIAPVECARVEQDGPHRIVEGRHSDALFEEPAVDVGKLAKILVKRGLAGAFGRVEHLKQVTEPTS